MKLLLVTSFFMSSIAFSATQVLTKDEAQSLACSDKIVVQYQTDGVCENELALTSETKLEYIFSGNDISGDCELVVHVNKKSGKIKSSAVCN